jgi:MIF4G domain
MELCMKNLLHPPEGPTELDVECFCILLSTIGAKLEVSPKGSKVIDKYLSNLEEIVDNFAESFVLRIRCMILDVFELRANNWNPLRPDQIPLTVAPENKVKDASEFIEAARETREFLKEVDVVLSQLGREKLLDFMYRFMDVKYTAERLEGATKIIFERAISSQETSMFALVCKGLAGVVPYDGAGDQVMVAFKEYLLRLIRSEIEVIKNNVVAFRGILQRLESLKREGDKTKMNKMKAALEKDFRLSSRAVDVSTFIAELYNADFIESRFIFDEVFIVLLNQKFVSDASIECFCKLVKLAGTKMMTEKNRDKLMKEEMMRLFEGARNIDVFPKTKFVIQDIISFTRFQMKLPLDNHFAYEINEYPRLDFPWSSTLLNWSNEPLGKKDSKRIRKKRQLSMNQSDDIKYEAAAARQFVSPKMPSQEYISKVAPPNVSFFSILYQRIVD